MKCTCRREDCRKCPYFMGLYMEDTVLCWLDLWRRVCSNDVEHDHTDEGSPF